MTGNKVTGLLAAAAVALGMITMGCVEDDPNDRDISLYAPTDMTKAELIEKIAKSSTVGLHEVGFIDGNTGVYHFDNGLILDPSDVADVDETDLMVPGRCEDDECTEGDGHYPLGGDFDIVIGGRELEGGDILKAGSGGECTEESCDKATGGIEPNSPCDASWMTIENHEGDLFVCWGWCIDMVCYEVCKPA